jgi:hypothetical protein
MTSREILTGLVPFHAAIRVNVNYESQERLINLQAADKGNACAFYKLVFPDAKLCYMIIIKWDARSTLKQLVEAVELSRACTNDLKCERYSCHESDKECTFRMYNGLDGEASRSCSANYWQSTGRVLAKLVPATTRVRIMVNHKKTKKIMPATTSVHSMVNQHKQKN